MIRWIILWIIILIIGSAHSSQAQDFDASNYDVFIEETMVASNIPGLAVIIFDDDGMVYEKAFGIAGPDKRAVTLDTPFQLGSVSKSFAAVVMIQLAAEGQSDLDAPVITYLPEFRTLGSDSWKDITLRHILSHHSGLSTFDGNRIQENDYRGEDALDFVVKHLGTAKLTSTPGEQFEYSNANYMLAAAVIEAITGQSYETVLDERVFKPLGMTNSYIQMPLGESEKEATGYRQWFGKSFAYPHIPGRVWMAAGGATTSARDLVIYLKAVANKDPRIMPPAEFADELISPQGTSGGDFAYGLGWMLWEEDDHQLVYHSGLNGGFAAQAAFIPDEKSGGVVLTNQSGSLQADVPGAVLRKGLGLQPGISKPSTAQHFMVWGLLATVLILLGSYILSTIRFAKYAKSVGRVNRFRRVISSLLLFGLAIVLIQIVPKANGITLGGMRVFVPDIWLCLSLSAAIAVVWGVTRLIYPR